MIPDDASMALSIKKNLATIEKQFRFFFAKFALQILHKTSSGFISTLKLQTTRGFCITSDFVVKSLHSSNLHMKHTDVNGCFVHGSRAHCTVKIPPSDNPKAGF